jgi:hypothetical protein
MAGRMTPTATMLNHAMTGRCFGTNATRVIRDPNAIQTSRAAMSNILTMSIVEHPLISAWLARHFTVPNDRLNLLDGVHVDNRLLSVVADSEHITSGL